MIDFIKNFFLTRRFFIVGGSVILAFVIAFLVPELHLYVMILLAVATLIVMIDTFLLFFNALPFEVTRHHSRIFSLGNENEITIQLKNRSKYQLNVKLIDELPYQLQIRDSIFILPQLEIDKEITLKYNIRPVVRGEYVFGDIQLFTSSILGLIERRITIPLETKVAVYPSLIDMKKYQLSIQGRSDTMLGIRKIRKIGQSSEFEQIKEYSKGDDYNRINWKSTSRLNKLMINSYTDEKSQLIYCIIDKSRSMNMPFAGMSLMDYAINTALTISNTALLKKDNVGLYTFSNKIDTVIKADRKQGHLKRLLEALHNEQETDLEADFEKLYFLCRNTLKKRSLLFLFTNFETRYAMQRALPMIRNLNKTHLLIPIIFENSELLNYCESENKTIKDIYLTTVAFKYANEKVLIVNELNKHGIQTIYTTPEDLSTNVLNKYLELKARGMI